MSSSAHDVLCVWDGFEMLGCALEGIAMEGVMGVQQIAQQLDPKKG
jgi:hypothetical protein